MELSAALASSKATLTENLGESAQHVSTRKSVSEVQANKCCSKSFVGPVQVYHKKPISLISADDIGSTPSTFSEYLFSIYCSPSQKDKHARPNWDRMELFRSL